MKISSDLWDFAYDGMSYLEKMIGIIESVLKKWKELGVQHSLKVP